LSLSASHSQSMTGVAFNTGLGPMTCARGLITGSHILRWYCQFDTDPTQYRLEAPILFVPPRPRAPDSSLGRVSSAAVGFDPGQIGTKAIDHLALHLHRWTRTRDRARFSFRPAHDLAIF